MAAMGEVATHFTGVTGVLISLDKGPHITRVPTLLLHRYVIKEIQYTNNVHPMLNESLYCCWQQVASSSLTSIDDAIQQHCFGKLNMNA